MRGRGDRLEGLLGERELDRLLVTDLTNVGYLTGFTGTNGACICGPGGICIPGYCGMPGAPGICIPGY